MKNFKFRKTFGYTAVCIATITVLLSVWGCSDKDKSMWRDVPNVNTFRGWVSLSVVDIQGRPFPGIPVVMKVQNSVDPGQVLFDTVYTNEYGVAFLDLKVTSLRSADAGHIVIDIDGAPEAISRYFIDGEQFYLIYRIFRDRNT
ncbi:MAG: hypothetical protein GYA46_03430 [candidate division Zixibacteria bacterium]|nr:hypothetical protein [candidate division Zixibacteria bacterium]